MLPFSTELGRRMVEARADKRGLSAIPASTSECLFDRSAVPVAMSENQFGLASVLRKVVDDLVG